MERRPITGQRRGRPGLNPCPWLALATAALVSLSPLAQARAGTPAVAQGGPAPMGIGMGMGGGPQGQRSADAHFIVMMIPHHDGAIAMAELALQRARHPEIRALAQRIQTSQTKENAQMRQWYGEWFGGPVPTWPGAGGGWGMGMGRRACPAWAPACRP